MFSFGTDFGNQKEIFLSKVQKYSGIQAFKHSGIQAFKHSGIQAFKHSGIQVRS